MRDELFGSKMASSTERSNETAPADDEPAFRRRAISALGPLGVLLAVVAIFAIADEAQGGVGHFLSVENLCTVAVQSSIVAVAALGMTVIVIAGGIDLSAGTALTLSATVLATCLDKGASPGVAVAFGLATGCATGLFNGLLVGTLKIVPFIVTLGTMTVFLGLGKILAKETTVRPKPDRIPAWIPALVDINPQPIVTFATGVWLLLGLAVVLSLVLHCTVFGRYVFAIGSNEATARLCGIPVARVKMAVYALAGFFVGIAGLYQFARLQAADPMSGRGMELKIIASVVIGGASLNGGRGSVLGTLCGAVLMALIAASGTLLGLDPPHQDILIGLIIVAAVTTDQLRQRRTGG